MSTSDVAGLRRELERLGKSPYPAWITSGALFVGNGLTLLKHPGLPPFVQLSGFWLIFGFSGYATTKDWQNGAGISTAWSMSYLFLNAKRAVKSRGPAALALTSVMLGNLAIYGTTWWNISDQDSMAIKVPTIR
ncbi:uncharacterized protein L969DRAFT_43635 [Mixia osmundae IAM 14324]|uniref:Uncharacterized protein n=1 Tax=Mixia osmundae (strain CBS 9802 / IAM 14324 / JCM 22182 / KY 12970) TaxID=764103 RepID=G7DZV0_MIXOS|nr:uncharacterized protein L969DRAFT_43635 [Mixia osmundae IAM 14324]KEI42103.1 hypothetical protein L969DRAFT_43635 [Mixia osmundae IAM 14324]GAA96110.1 hypothetical protein E5Q_02771 [Mixia osmundae IAM 14324]